MTHAQDKAAEEPPVTDLHARLEVVSQQIEAAKARLAAYHRWHDRHAMTGRDLQARYAAIRSKVEEEASDEEANGHHVSVLEKSVRQWLHEIEH